VRSAEADYRGALRLVGGSDALHHQSCFFLQQASEKYLKSLLEETGSSIPRTHRLQDLLPLLMPHYPSLRGLRRGLVFLTKFAVTTRYPGDRATKRDALAALRWTGRVPRGAGTPAAAHRKSP
jgi:HEPN domain-containing protein